MGDSSVHVYWMSGTGNTRRVAGWIADEARARGGRVVCESVEEARSEADFVPGSDSLLWIAFPTHGFTAPWHVLRFVAALPRGRGARAAAVATRAGMRFGRVYTPGVAGTGVFLVGALLWLKGYRWVGGRGIDMPSNWVAFHPGLGPETYAGIIARAEPRTRRLAGVILEGGAHYRGWIDLALGFLLAPVSFLYLVLGRFFLAKIFFASNRCTGCGVCAASCPVGAIRMKGRRRPRPYWTFDCESCMRCMAYCPERAIEAGHSFGALLWWIGTFPVGLAAVGALAAAIPALGPVGESPGAAMLAQYLYRLGVLAGVYAIFWWAIHVGWINGLFRLTTLTALYRRSHDPDTTLSDLPAHRPRD